MKPNFPLTGRCLLALGLSLWAIDRTSAAEAPPAEAALLLECHEFAARLAEPVFVQRSQTISEGAMPLRKALVSWSAAASALADLPDKAEPASVALHVAPWFPYELRKERVQGVARFVLLIGADGKLQAMCCYERTRPQFQESAAAALARWQYRPARVRDRSVPSVIEQTITFSLSE